MQWPKEKEQNDKQRSTKHTHKTRDRVPRTPLKTGGELRCSPLKYHLMNIPVKFGLNGTDVTLFISETPIL